MIEVPVEQGSDAWRMCRVGIPTASQFGRIVTPKELKYSESRHGYMAELLANYFVGELTAEDQKAEKEQKFASEWMDRGKRLEPQALAYYSMIREVEVERAGFFFRDDSRTSGASPDLVMGPAGDRVGGGELKCPMAATHLAWLTGGRLPAEHVAQVQGELWVTGFPWIDFMSYYPGLPSLLIRVEPHPDFQAALDRCVPHFIGELFERRKRLIEMGVPDPLAPKANDDREWFDRTYGTTAQLAASLEAECPTTTN